MAVDTPSAPVGQSRLGSPLAPSSPPARRLRPPRWLDSRLLVGVTLALLAVVLGAYIVGRASRTTDVWVATHDLTAGHRVVAGDLRVVKAHLDADAGGRYLGPGTPGLSGRVLQRLVASGELLPVSALTAPADPAPTRLVTISVPRDHVVAPLTSGAHVDVIATYRGKDGSRTQAVLRDVLVDGADLGQAAAGTSATVTVRVRPDQVLPLTAAIESARLDVVVVDAGRDRGDVGGAPVSVDAQVGQGAGDQAGTPTPRASATP